MCDGAYPYPPLRLAGRVGRIAGLGAPPYELYERVGRTIREQVVGLLPPDWSFEGRRVLDFGCGSGRVLRHFTAEAENAEFLGCDIDEEAVAWIKQNLSPRFRVFRSGVEPPLPLDSESVDLVWAFSVFTHLTDNWAAWLLELHRVLRPGGVLIATFLNRGWLSIAHEGWVKESRQEAWNEALVGMNVLQDRDDWDLGGPLVIHSTWWIEEHWGRAFDVVQIEPVGFGTAGEAGIGQGYALLRKRSVEASVEILERVSPDDLRELQALQHNVRQLRRQMRALATAYEGTHSWRLTRPLRRLGTSVREAKVALAQRRP